MRFPTGARHCKSIVFQSLQVSESAFVTVDVTDNGEIVVPLNLSFSLRQWLVPFSLHRQVCNRLPLD